MPTPGHQFVAVTGVWWHRYATSAQRNHTQILILCQCKANIIKKKKRKELTSFHLLLIFPFILFRMEKICRKYASAPSPSSTQQQQPRVDAEGKKQIQNKRK